MTRALAPARQQDSWDLLIARISWVLERLGAEVERTGEIADTMSQSDGLDEDG